MELILHSDERGRVVRFFNNLGTFPLWYKLPAMNGKNLDTVSCTILCLEKSKEIIPLKISR